MTGPAPPRMLPPGSVIGMLGAGQLGRMTALAAARLGYKVHLFAPEGADTPCGQIATETTAADWLDLSSLARFARSVDVVTLEWENVPTAAVEFLAERVPVHPGASVLAVAQDRLEEKRFANAIGLATAPFRAVRSLAELEAALAALGTPSILKTTRFGYDGKGQVRLREGDDLAAAWASLKGAEAILEGWIDFDCEISVIVARRADGATAVFPPGRNNHRNGILDTTTVPTGLGAEIEGRAETAALRLAEALGVVGLLAVEFFVTRAGEVLVNEIAPRPHNSGHWTQDFAVTDQFEQLVRAICGLPFGATRARAPCRMTNLIGDDSAAWAGLLAEPEARVHLYGKGEARPGRKMGHVNRAL